MQGGSVLGGTIRGLLGLPWNCSSQGCTIRALILCSELWVNQVIAETEEELLRQLPDPVKNFSYSLTFFPPEVDSLSSELLQVLSATVCVCVGGCTPVFLTQKYSEEHPSGWCQVQLHLAWALLKLKVLQLCCHSNWVIQADTLALSALACTLNSCLDFQTEEIIY